jgi:hypothetical protein
MADINVAYEAPKAGGRNSWILALVAILAIGGLMWYLAAESAKVQHTVALEQEADAEALAADAGLSGEAAELAAIAAAPENFAGRELHVADLAVAATLGDGAFWADVPGANPFLVVVAPGVAPPAALGGGHQQSVTGAVEPVSDAVLDEWVAAGTLRDGARDEAAFATHYLRADAITAH